MVRLLHSIFRSALVGTFVILASSLCAESKQDFKLATFVNKDEHYSIDFPTTWTIDNPGESDNVAAISPPEKPSDTRFENVEIWVDALETPTTPEAYFSQSQENLRQHSTEFEVRSQGVVTLGGVPAHWFQAFIKRGEVEGEILQYQMIVDDRLYIINCTAEPVAYSRFEGIFQAIASSFRLD